MTLLFVLACTLWTVIGAASVFAVTRRRSPAPGARPPMTVLKPLCGTDPGLEANLESFFVQDYRDYDVVFGVESADDPAVAVAARVMHRHPERFSKLVVHGLQRGTNPKIRNLRGMIGHARHDLVAVSDSNVRVPAGYLCELCDEYLRGPAPAGLVTNLVRGRDADGVGGVLESVQLVGFCAAGVAGPSLVGEALVIGKSMLFSKAALDELGGLESLSNVLAEDYVMGKMFQHAGYAVRVAPTAIENVTAGATVGSFFARQLRWSMLRCRLRPLAYVLEPIASPVAMLPFAWLLLGPWALLWVASMLFVRDGLQWVFVGGRRGVISALAVAPLRELLSIAVFVCAPFHRHVAWRGRRVRLSSGTLAYAARRR